MSKKYILHKENYRESLKYDFPAGVVVFLVAIPLCLGIALASGAPFFSGIIAGVIGGILVPLISQSQMSVSGPAAGLTAIVLAAIADIGSFNGFLVALFIAGLIQIVLGFYKSGFIAYYIPSSVIKGMLAAIGLILILKQLPHAIGYDVEIFEDDKFLVSDKENTFTLLLNAIGSIKWGALIISAISLVILIIWEKSSLKKFKWIPGALVVVFVGAFINYLFESFAPQLKLSQTHRVNLPIINNFDDFIKGFNLPDWSYLSYKSVWINALTIGLIASIETLLTLEAIDKLDPFKRKSPLNRELVAQGVGNSVLGLIGGIPVTSVIVRSSAGINAGGRTKLFVLIHGFLLFGAVVFISRYLNYVPLACLAAILLQVGYKLAKPSVFKAIYRTGYEQFIPFVVTVSAVLLSDLLIGVGIGIFVGLVFVIRSNFHSSVLVKKDEKSGHFLIKLNKDVSFLNKPVLMTALETIEENSQVTIDASRSQFIDYDVMELLEEFRQEAKLKNIGVKMRNFKLNATKNESFQVFEEGVSK